MPTGDVIPLDGGGWQLRGCLGGEWRWHTGPGKPWDAPRVVSGQGARQRAG